MEKLIDKISSYNLFNNLFPGIIFAVISEKYTWFSFRSWNLLFDLFVCYFIGLVISRFGSLCIEPLLKALKFVKFAEYKEFITAIKIDPEIKILLEASNMYRTICSMIILLPVLRLYQWIEQSINYLICLRIFVFILLMIVVFLLSYRKQTEYIIKRIKASNNKRLGDNSND